VELLKQTELVSKGVDGLKKYISDVCVYKAEVAERRAEVVSPIGKRIMARYVYDRDKVRSSYANIQVGKLQDRDVIMTLLAMQVEERLLTEQIRAMDEALKIIENVDKHLEVCHAVLESRKNAASR